jgi:hypothetical protein
MTAELCQPTPSTKAEGRRDDEYLSAEAAERFIVGQKAITRRACGTCSMCCRLLDVPGADKPKGDWCPQARPGRAGQRPQICRSYSCRWLVDPMFGDEWFPPRSKIIVDTHRDVPSQSLYLR